MGKGERAKKGQKEAEPAPSCSTEDDPDKPANLQTKVPVYYRQFIDSVKGRDRDELIKLGQDLRRDLPVEVFQTIAPDKDFKSYKADRGANIVRRLCHVAGSLSLLYYLFGDTLFGVPKQFLLFICLSIIPLCIEIVRIKKNIRILGIREHEKKKVASYIWFTHASLILILICPPEIAIPVILTASLGDPIIGETRRFRRSIAFMVGILFCCAVFWLYGYNFLMGAVAGMICFLGEATEFGFRWSVRRDLFYSRHQHKEHWMAKYADFITKTDDDFTMQFFPGIILLIIYFLMPVWFPDPHPWLTPLDFLVALG